MQRLRVKDERGAVAIIVALLMVVLLGFAAIAVDVSAMWAEKRQLQNGADAGALAIAQACAKGACGSPDGTAQSYVSLNRNGGTPTGTATVSGNSVTVLASDPHENWFAQVIGGGNESGVSAEATAKWGWPTGGSTFPLAFSVCEWNAQGGLGGLDSTTQRKIVLSKTSTSNCTGPSGNVVPGGFGWVDPDGGCTEVSIINGWIKSDSGNTPPNGCSPSDFQDLIGKTVLIPVFDQFTGTGDHAEYKVYGYAAFTFTGYYFSGQNKEWPASGVGSCNGNERCIAGYFTRYVDLNEVLDIGAGPQLGAAVVTLTK